MSRLKKKYCAVNYRVNDRVEDEKKNNNGNMV